MARFPELNGKVALITGAGRRGGLGEGIARRLLEEGCKVLTFSVIVLTEMTDADFTRWDAIGDL